ncbi:MAG TPA: TolC family protein [Ideonella sp.]|uniref:TolC family protein n=1 Tax=Ideonella sp. TaxID=1929293 RepID=UPI002BE426AD|nr:TolC family protein [Ideonella sp.]HSI48061.1 TolC family protein [Ideonella sp.]
MSTRISALSLITRALLAASALTLAGTGMAHAACAEGLTPLAQRDTPSGDASAPRLTLLNLIQAAEQRSKAVGAAKLLADAARSDVEETKAGALPTATLSAAIGPSGDQMEGQKTRNQFQVRPGLTVSAMLYDSGRNSHLTQWRTSLAEAANQGQISTTEQVALQTVILSFERDRYRLHAQVWSQYAAKVCTLVDSLEQIVATDRGRGSELVQARKTLQQVLLSRAQSMTQLRLTETRLRRLVGDTLPEANGLSALMLQPPALPELQSQAAGAASIAQLAAQADAADSLARATDAGNKVQANWLLSVAKNATGDRAGNWNAGITINVPLLNPAAAPASTSARLRAEAARVQRAESLDALQNRLAEVHEQAGAALVRARDTVTVLKSSERVRDDTIAQWQQLGKRSLFDVISAEGDHFNLRIAYVDALHDGQESIALLYSLAGSVKLPLN